MPILRRRIRRRRPRRGYRRYRRRSRRRFRSRIPRLRREVKYLEYAMSKSTPYGTYISIDPADVTNFSVCPTINHGTEFNNRTGQEIYVTKIIFKVFFSIIDIQSLNCVNLYVYVNWNQSESVAYLPSTPLEFHDPERIHLYRGIKMYPDPQKNTFSRTYIVPIRRKVHWLPGVGDGASPTVNNIQVATRMFWPTGTTNPTINTSIITRIYFRDV